VLRYLKQCPKYQLIALILALLPYLRRLLPHQLRLLYLYPLPRFLRQYQRLHLLRLIPLLALPYPLTLPKQR
jgi:hypothetical protein